jgi:hypothetical protein
VPCLCLGSLLTVAPISLASCALARSWVGRKLDLWVTLGETAGLQLLVDFCA